MKVKLPRAECTQYDMPPVCVVTGATEGIVWKPIKFQYMPQWAYFFGGIILGSIFMKKMTAEMPFTEQSYAAHQRAKVMTYVNLFGFIALMVGGAAAAGTLGDKGGAVFALAFLAALVFALVTYIAVIRQRSPRCRWMNDEFIELDLPSKAAVEAIRERFGAERTKPRGLFG